jgi:hypothetical protein
LAGWPKSEVEIDDIEVETAGELDTVSKVQDHPADGASLTVVPLVEQVRRIL